jgi:hypothetical protein
MKEEDQTYAEWHREQMNRDIDLQDADLKRRFEWDYDYYILRGISALIVFAVLMSFVSIALVMVIR